MADIKVEPLGESEQATLMEWLDEAATWNIAVANIDSVDEAYESFMDRVLEQEDDEREDPTTFVAMVSFALGQWLSNETVLEWRVITDDEGRDLGLALPDESSIMFPSDFVADAWNEMKRNWLADWARDLKNQLEALR